MLLAHPVEASLVIAQGYEFTGADISMRPF